MVEPGFMIHHWTVVAVDGRAAVCRCACGRIKTLSVDAIEGNSVVPSCGCQPLQRYERALLRGEG